MNFIKANKLSWTVLISIVLLAMPMWLLANQPGTQPDIDHIKQMRQIQNRATIMQNLKTQSIQVTATPEQERIKHLSDALNQVTGHQNIPDLKQTPNFRLGQTNIQVPQVQQNSTREVIFNHGVLSSDPGMEYFNFLLGINAPDSAQMDVRITGNEGTNFGDEGANWPDPSLLLYFAPMGSLDSIFAVPPIDDPLADWQTVSWAANGYQPLAVDNIYVVYARTSQMYVALEVTNVDPWGQYFEFDYMIQDDGSPIFDGEPGLTDMTVNGVYADTLEIGSNPYFEITLDSTPDGQVVVFWDANHNGFWDEGDFPIDSYSYMDNDIHDEDPADGVFGFTYTDDMAEGINYITDDLLFVAFSGMGYAETSVSFYSLPSPFMVSGHVIDGTNDMAAIPGIIVMAFNEDTDYPAIIDITDDEGYYQLELPDTGWVFVQSQDFFELTPGLIPTPPEYDLPVYGSVEDMDFIYDMASAFIEGTVIDETGAPMVDIEVMADAGESYFSGITDETGYYEIPVMPGFYKVDVSWNSLPEPMMLPFSEDAEVDVDETVIIDLLVRHVNSMISGMLLVDGAPFADATIWAMHPDLGYSVTMSDPEGGYAVPVLDEGGTVYDMGAFIEGLPNVIMTSDNNDVPAGTPDELITFETVTGGMQGFFINGETGEPIADAWQVGMHLTDIINGYTYDMGPGPDAYYEIWLPDGLYEVIAGGEGWMMGEPDTVEIAGSMIDYDILLWPMTYDTFLEGYVVDLDGNPIPDAQVFLGNEDFGNGTMTDETGWYHIDAPYGYYQAGAMADGFYDMWIDVDLTAGPMAFDFQLEAYAVDGAITGHVFDMEDGSDISGASVFIFNEFESWGTSSDESGNFWLDVPNGDYNLVIDHNDYATFWIDGIEVNNDTVYVDAPMELYTGGLEGYVYDDNSGIPIQDAQVIIVNVADSSAFWMYSDFDGYYNIPALNGDYEVFVNAEGYEPSDAGIITIADSWENLDIYMVPHDFAAAPEINFIIDQPNDQGRQVRMQFWPGGTDWGPYMGYSVWRLTHTPLGDIFDFVDYIPNHDFEAYNLVAPTLVDSSAFNPDPEYYISAFMVTGHWDTYGYIDGEPGFGWSVDNIVPGIPGPLALLSTGETGVEIGWEASMDNDFQYFEVHRSLDPDFNTETIQPTVDPDFVDTDVNVGDTYYYMVTAVDANGNVSEGTNVISTSIVSVNDEQALPTAFGLSQNYPNPFNPTTSITFALPEASQVSLEIYNILGQKVRTLVNGFTPAGYITTSWDGLDQNGQNLSSGTYIYRLQTNDMSFSKKMILMK